MNHTYPNIKTKFYLKKIYTNDALFFKKLKKIKNYMETTKTPLHAALFLLKSNSNLVFELF